MQSILGASWRTTTSGLVAILAAVGAGATLVQHNNFNFTSPEWLGVGGALSAGVGNLFARDNKVTSESAGATTPPVAK